MCIRDSIETIQEYLADNNLTATQDDSGIFYIIDEEGTGTTFPTSFAEISMAYTGYLMDGTQFDSRTAVSPLNINLGDTILGWIIGVQKFKKGGKGTILIPSPLAYSNSALPGIPANSILIFDIELLDFTN